METFDDLVREACKGLFADYALELAEVSIEGAAAEEPMLYCGAIGFTGDDLRGSLLLAATEGALARTSPVPGQEVREWMAELVNQLAGRVKNRLLRRGTAIYISTPIVLRGQHLAPLPRHELVPLAFRSDDAFVCVWLDVAVREGFRCVQVSKPPPFAEGDAVMFF